MATKRLDFRIDETTQKNLDNLILKSGYNKTEIMTTLINNASISDFKMIDKKRTREINLLSVRKYLSYLFKNFTTNLNQISYKVNSSNINENNKEELKKEIEDLRKSVNKLTEQIKDKTVNDLAKDAKKKKEDLKHDKQSN